jgi:hypothetical protein
MSDLKPLACRYLKHLLARRINLSNDSPSSYRLLSLLDRLPVVLNTLQATHREVLQGKEELVMISLIVISPHIKVCTSNRAAARLAAILAFVLLCIAPACSDRLFAFDDGIFREARKLSLVYSYDDERCSPEQFRYISQPFIPAIPQSGDVVKHSDINYLKYNYFSNRMEQCYCPGYGYPCQCV